MGGVFLLLIKISFYGTTLILVILILVLCFKFNKKTENKVNDKVSNEYIASYFDGEYQTEIPGKNDGYIVDKIVCDNGASATWDNEEWGINIRNATKKIKCSIYFKFQFEQNFDYTGTEQALTIPKTGTYKLETWGAQGGNGADGHTIGGYGGYSVGTIDLKENATIYINVGGQRLFNTKSSENLDSYGGYNGGGNSSNYYKNKYVSGGGGATHIAYVSGLLNTLEKELEKVFIVSGGGGGTASEGEASNGGAGGGYKGNSGTTFRTDDWCKSHANQCFPGIGGSQKSQKDNDFGNGLFSGDGAGGGGGYYGGNGGSAVSGGGGSGYIGNSLLTNKVMYCYNCEESSEESTKTISTTCAKETPNENCAKKGNGYARITFIE